MKKVTYITRYFPVHSQTFIVNQVVYAKKAGFNISVLTYNLKNFNESSQNQLLTDNNIKPVVNIIDFKIPKSRLLKYIKSIIFFLKYFKYSSKVTYKSLSDFLFFKPYLINFFYNFKTIDVFHIHFADAGLDIASMKKIGLLQGNLVLSLHGFSVHYQNEIEKQKLITTYKELFEQSKHITVNSQYLFDKMISLECERRKLLILPMGVNTDFYKDSRLKELNGKLKLISVGRLIELKGHEYGIKSVKRLIDKGVNVVYTIVGVGRNKENLVALVKSLAIENHVRFLGKKSQSDLKKLYSENHIFLMTSITDHQNRAEAQGVVTLEAQAMGLPVVAFDSGGVKSTLNSDTGFLIKEKAVDNYTDAILKLYNNKSLYNSMSLNAVKFVNENFALSKLSKRLVELYD